MFYLQCIMLVKTVQYNSNVQLHTKHHYRQSLTIENKSNDLAILMNLKFTN